MRRHVSAPGTKGTASGGPPEHDGPGVRGSDAVHPSVHSTVKRLMDLMIAVVGLILLAPVLMMITLVVAATMGRPVLFRQVRAGYRGRPFTIYKFRTMREAYRADGGSLSDVERLTGWGRFLRKTSLDELPQLWNVIRGDLSLVGPRPQLVQYLPLDTPEQARRHEVRPGITGWAQINGRNAISWDEKFRYDAWYVDHWSLGLDARTLLITIIKVIRCEGINERGGATVTPLRAPVAATFCKGLKPMRGGMLSSEDQDLLLRSYKDSHFANVPEILLGYREASLNVKKQCIMRYYFIRSLYCNLWLEGAYGAFLRSSAVVLLKLSVDILAITTGLNYRLLGHRARPISAGEQSRWDSLWREVRLRDGDE